MSKVRALPEELQNIAIKELNEVPSRVPADIEALKTWIKQQPHLTARTDDQFLLAYLRGCKFSLERCKHKLDNFYTVRTQYPELFQTTDIDDKITREVLMMGALVPLPKPLNDNGPRIILLRNGVYDPDKYSFEQVFRMGQFIQEILMLEDDYVMINGAVTIMDLENVTMQHFFQMTPSLVKKLSVYSEEALPTRQKGTHFINTPPGFAQIFNVFRPMLSTKQQSRLYVHGSDMEALHAQIPLKYLPKEYGGENSSIEEICKIWNLKFDEYREHFKENVNYGANEKYRVGKPIDFNNLFGVDGSFRKLDVD